MAPGTFTTLEALVPTFERRRFQVERKSEPIEHPGKLPGEPQTIALILGWVGAVAGCVSAVYQALQYHRKLAGRAGPAAPVDVGSPVAVRPPIVIRVRWGGGQSSKPVRSEAEAQAMDLQIEGLPEDQPVEIVLERESLQ